eukprot:gene12286-biopygen10307
MARSAMIDEARGTSFRVPTDAHPGAPRPARPAGGCRVQRSRAALAREPSARRPPAGRACGAGAGRRAAAPPPAQLTYAAPVLAVNGAPVASLPAAELLRRHNCSAGALWNVAMARANCYLVFPGCDRREVRPKWRCFKPLRAQGNPEGLLEKPRGNPGGLHSPMYGRGHRAVALRFAPPLPAPVQEEVRENWRRPQKSLYGN